MIQYKISFQEIKSLLETAPVLAMPNPDVNYSDTNASIYGCGGVLLQQANSEAYGQKIDKTMTKWQELYGLVYAMETWRRFFEGVNVDLFTFQPVPPASSLAENSKQRDIFIAHKKNAGSESPENSIFDFDIQFCEQFTVQHTRFQCRAAFGANQ